MAIIKSFCDLDVYGLGREQTKRIFLIFKVVSKEETYSLTDKIRRSSRTVNAMITGARRREMCRVLFIIKTNEAMSATSRPVRRSSLVAVGKSWVVYP